MSNAVDKKDRKMYQVNLESKLYPSLWIYVFKSWFIFKKASKQISSAQKIHMASVSLSLVYWERKCEAFFFSGTKTYCVGWSESYTKKLQEREKGEKRETGREEIEKISPFWNMKMLQENSRLRS